LLAVGHDNRVRIWDTANGDLLDTLAGHTAVVEGLLWSADGKTLTSDAADGMRDWDVATGPLLRHRKWRMGAPSADRRFGAAGSTNTVRVWDLETGQSRLTLMLLSDDRWVAFSPDGHYRSSPRIERDLVYVVHLEDGTQRLLTPAEFATRCGWKNDPDRVGLK
jgi:WD40 repeat protein